MNCYIIRYAEIALKGNNRNFFENKLIDNIKSHLKFKNKNYESIKRVRGRILIYSTDNLNCLKTVFGISSFSAATELEQDISLMKEKGMGLVKKQKTFAVKVNRADKNFKMKSPELQQEIGGYIYEKTKIAVDLKNPELLIGIELAHGKAYIYTSIIQGAKGMPVGSSNKSFSLIQDNLLASLLFLKRGTEIYPISFEQKDISLLKEYGCTQELKIIKDIKELEKISKEKNIGVIVLNNYEDYVALDSSLTAFSPLISYTKKQVDEGLNNYQNNLR